MAYSAEDSKKANGDSASMKKVHDLAMDRHAAAEQFDLDERELVIEDHLFCDKPGSQWDSYAARGRKQAKRPMYEINRVAGARNQFVGDQLQNRIEMRVRPKGGEATQDVAEIVEGIIRSIRDDSGSAWKDNALKECATGGIGAFEVCTRYSNEDGWDQEIYLRAIRSAATSVWVDPGSIDDCHADAQWISVVRNLTPEAFQEKWPLSKAANFRLIGINGCRAGWRTQEMVRVSDYYVKEPIKRKLVRMSDGKTYEDNEDFKKVEDDLAQQNIYVSARKTVNSHKVLHYKLSGAEVLEGPNEIKGMELPVILGYGFSTWIDGAHFYSGMIRKSKDPQRVYNYETSSSVETGALAPKDPYWVSTDQAKGYEGQLGSMGTKNDPVQFYNSDPKNPGPPRRTGAPAVQAAQGQRIRQAEMDVQATSGYFAASLGDNPMNQSGIALKSQQKQGFTGTFEIADNHAKMLFQAGKVILGMIPHYYDGTRIQRILAEDGETKMVTLNEVVTDADTGEEVTLIDLSKGTYDLKIDIGPSFATKREEAVTYLTEVSRTNPNIANMTTDLVLKNMDFPGAREAAKRARKVGLKEGFVEPNEEEQAEQAKQKPDPMQLIQFEMLKADLETRVANVDKIDLENDKLRSETAENWAKVQELIKGEGIRTVKEMAAAEQAVAQVEKTIVEARMADAKQNQPQQPQGQS